MTSYVHLLFLLILTKVYEWLVVLPFDTWKIESQRVYKTYPKSHACRVWAEIKNPDCLIPKSVSFLLCCATFHWDSIRKVTPVYPVWNLSPLSPSSPVHNYFSGSGPHHLVSRLVRVYYAVFTLLLSTIRFTFSNHKSYHVTHPSAPWLPTDQQKELKFLNQICLSSTFLPGLPSLVILCFWLFPYYLLYEGWSCQSTDSASPYGIKRQKGT